MSYTSYTVPAPMAAVPLENRMELTGGEKQTDDASEVKIRTDLSTSFFQKPGRNPIKYTAC